MTTIGEQLRIATQAKTPEYYKPEGSIPIPMRGGNGSGEWKALASTMKTGDSILVKNTSEASGLSSACVKLGYRITQRKVEGGVRIWRV